jgi:hypothetical protein
MADRQALRVGKRLLETGCELVETHRDKSCVKAGQKNVQCLLCGAKSSGFKRQAPT